MNASNFIVVAERAPFDSNEFEPTPGYLTVEQNVQFFYTSIKALSNNKAARRRNDSGKCLAAKQFLTKEVESLIIKAHL